MAKTLLRQGLVALLLVLMVACAGRQGPRTLEERAQLRWDSLTSGQLETAYQLYSPGYRSTVSLDAFKLKHLTRTVRWVKGQFIDRVECTEQVCKVSIDITYEVRNPTPGAGKYRSNRRVQERWINIDGDWYFVPEATR